jgi:hypothetical protein
MFGLGARFLVFHKMQQFLPVLPEEGAPSGDKSGRVCVVNTVAGRAPFLVGLGRPVQPLPSPIMEDCPAIRTHRGFREFVFGLVGIMPGILHQAVAPNGLISRESGFHLALLRNCRRIKLMS